MNVELEESGEQLPSPGVPAWVQCEGFRCLAARGEDGIWRTYPGKKPIEKVLAVLPFPT